MENKNASTLRGRILWITRTAVLVALLITLQWATSGTQVFAGQFITGSCVNAVLAVAALIGGLWSGVTVALLSPFCAFLLGIGPKLIQIVPGIAVGNLVFVVALHYFIGQSRKPMGQQAAGVALSAVAKFAALYLVVVKLIIPVLGESLKPQQVATFTAMFSWPQLVTAAIGGSVALLILPLLRKAIKN